MKLDKEEILRELKNFLPLYDERPIKDNVGGMQFQQLFLTYFFLKKLKPEFIVDSGTFKGLGTWLMEKTCPSAKILSIDLWLGKREYISKSKLVEYSSVDFIHQDFSNIPKNSLVFFDDHREALQRIIYSKWFGFDYVIFEDNQPDKYSSCTIKMILEKINFVRRFPEDSMRIGFKASLNNALYFSFLSFKMFVYTYFRSFFKFLFKSPIINFKFENINSIICDEKLKKNLLSNIDYYIEFPPMLPVTENVKFLKQDPIFNNKKELEEFCENKPTDNVAQYNFSCLIKLKSIVEKKLS